MTAATATALEPTTDQRAAMNAAYKMGLALGRKFEARDITTDDSVLYQAAMAFAQTYHGSFEYMTDMRSNASVGFLSANQAKGVLNCLMAEARRRVQVKPATAAPVAKTDYTSVLDGFYTVVFDAANPSDRITIQIEKWVGFRDKQSGQERDDVRSVRFLSGPDNEADYMFAAAIYGTGILFQGRSFGPRVQQALGILVQASGADRAVMGAAYAFESSRCWRCNRQLTVEDSVAGGIGPKCAKKIGVAYGGEALQAAKEAMARLQGSQAAPEPKTAPVAVLTHEMYTADGEAVSVTHDRYVELFGEDAA